MPLLLLQLRALLLMAPLTSPGFPVPIVEEITTKWHASTRSNVNSVRLNPTLFGFIHAITSRPGVTTSNVKVSGKRNPIREPLV